MELSPVCISTRSIRFNLFFAPWLALTSTYPSGPAFWMLCTTNYTGSPSQKGSSSNSVASFTNVYTIAHPGICLNTAYRSPRFTPGRSHLRSAASGDLFVPATSTKTIGPRGFFHAGPTAWNCLPPSMKNPNITFSMFKKLLKTELFQH